MTPDDFDFDRFVDRFRKTVWFLVVLGLVLACALIFKATRGNASLPPDDGYIYKADPCVEALRGAMEAMEPFLPTRAYQDGDGIWRSEAMALTDDGLQQWLQAQQTWREVKLQCWRH